MNPCAVEVLPGGCGDPVPQDQVALDWGRRRSRYRYFSRTFSEISPSLEEERRGLRFVEDLERWTMTSISPVSSRVHHALGALGRYPDGQDVFAPEPRLLHGRRGFRVEDDLDEAFPVPQVDENDAAVISPAMGPPMRTTPWLPSWGSEVPAIMGSFLRDEKIQSCYLTWIFLKYFRSYSRGTGSWQLSPCLEGPRPRPVFRFLR